MKTPRGTEPAGGDDIDRVAKLALDSAEVANRSAKAATHTASKLAEATARFDQALARQRKQTLLVIILGGFVVVLAFAMFLASAIQLRGRVTQINAMLGVLATRSVELRAGLDQIAPLAERVEGFATQVAAMTRLQREIQANLQGVEKTLAARPVSLASSAPATPSPAVAPPTAKPAAAAPRPPAPIETAEQAAVREKAVKQTLDAIQGLAAQVRTLEGSLRTQSAALSGMGNRVAAIERGIAAIPAMQSDLKLLLKGEQTRAAALDRVAAERQREEKLRTERERFVQFPRQQGASGGTQTGPATPDDRPVIIQR